MSWPVIATIILTPRPSAGSQDRISIWILSAAQCQMSVLFRKLQGRGEAAEVLSTGCEARIDLRPVMSSCSSLMHEQSHHIKLEDLLEGPLALQTCSSHKAATNAWKRPHLRPEPSVSPAIQSSHKKSGNSGWMYSCTMMILQSLQHLSPLCDKEVHETILALLPRVGEGSGSRSL